jgi:subtilisin family serine protease
MCGVRVSGLAGRKLRIAVVDTGINANHPHICAPTHRVIFEPEDSDTSCEDVLGHGTAVTAAIQDKVPDAEYYILKLFGKSLRAAGPRLISAIEWTIEQRMDIVNLSLGTRNPDHRAALEALVVRAAEARVILVAARQADQVPVLPGLLEGVISVDVDWSLSRDQYRVSEVDGRPVFYASGYPRPVPGVPVNRNLNGISFAVANMTGFVARVCKGLGEHSIDKVVRVLTSSGCEDTLELVNNAQKRER